MNQTKNQKINSLSYWRRMVFLFGIFRIPLIGFLRPRILRVDEKEVNVRIRLQRRSKNHLGSMYFGALAIGADLAAGIHAFYFAEKSGVKVSFAFKSMSAEFLKRAESNIIFITKDGNIIEKAVEESLLSKKRVNKMVKVEAMNEQNECVASFEMGVSIKVK